MSKSIVACTVVLVAASSTGTAAHATASNADGCAQTARALSPLAEQALVKIAMRPGSLPSEVALALGVSLVDAVEAIDELLQSGLVGRPA